MKTLKRTDEHRPSVIIPSEYEYVGLEYIKVHDLGDCLFIKEQRAIIQKHMDITGGTYSTHQHGGNCHICGAHAIYTVLFHHLPSNSYIRTGTDCAEMLDCHDLIGFRRFKDAIKAARHAKAGKRKAEGMLIEAGLERAWDIFKANQKRDESKIIELKAGQSDIAYRTDFGYMNAHTFEFQIQKDPELSFTKETYARLHPEAETLCNIVTTLIKYGKASEKQINFIKVLLERLDKKPELEAKYAAEKELAEDCPEGRIEIIGTVIKTAVKENAYGFREVMTVKDDRGFVVWGTIPRGLDVERNAKIQFTATIEPSERDEKFGFFTRPSKAEVLLSTQEAVS